MKTNRRETQIIEARAEKCECCGVEGVHVDTDAGEIVTGDGTVRAPTCEEWLMVDPGGALVCDDCWANEAQS